MSPFWSVRVACANTGLLSALACGFYSFCQKLLEIDLRVYNFLKVTFPELKHLNWREEHRPGAGN